jgi:hypothetical protein
MKAEHRKELETNTLADKVGEAMQRVKGGSRRRILLYVVAAAVLIVGGIIGFRWYALSKQETSLQWVYLDDGAGGHLVALSKTKGYAGKAARFQIAWFLYWEQGVRMIGVDPPGSMKALKQAGKFYEELADECKDDPIFEPQAMLGIAVVQETRAVQDTAMLKSAQNSYQALVDKYGADDKKAAEAIFAQKRLDIMKNKTKLKDLELVYEQLQQVLQVPGAQMAPNFLDPHLPIMKGKDDEKKKDSEKKEKSK